jgi:hypothetical protein
MGTESGEELDAQCNTRLTAGEEEKSWHNKEHDNIIITRAFFITRESTESELEI